MDGGSGLNLMYLKPLMGWGLLVTSSKASHICSMEWSPSGRSFFRSPSEMRATTLPHHPRVVVLCQVHGHPQLCLPQAQDTRTCYSYHHGGQAQRALDCEKDNIKLATTTVAVAELRELSTTRSRHATHIWRFQSTREDSVKIMQIGASLDHE
jgi:hypothetical protein